jgi:PAS domain S-box-containing protein
VEHPPQKNRSSPVPHGQPGGEFLADLYRHLPLLVVHLTLDGTLLHANPEVERVTGYAEGDLMGKNFWAILFPGRLFAQVPKFVSIAHPLQAFATDVPMTLRTRDGGQRVIAWSRFIHEGASSAEGSVAPSLVCVGKDLTDRLMDADNVGQPLPEERPAPAGGIEGEFVTPLAVSPPLPPSGESHVAAIEKVHDFLAALEGRVGAITSAVDAAELDRVNGLRQLVVSTEVAAQAGRVESLRQSATVAHVEEVISLIEQTGGLCRPAGDDAIRP